VFAAGYKHGTPKGVRGVVGARAINMALLKECVSCCWAPGYKHGTPKVVRGVVGAPGYKHRNPNGVRQLLLGAGLETWHS
jgi:hypothetical protein